MNDDFNLNCPVPIGDHATVQLTHGGGGRLMKNLIEEIFLPAFSAEQPHGPQSVGIENHFPTSSQLAAEAASPRSPAEHHVDAAAKPPQDVADLSSQLLSPRLWVAGGVCPPPLIERSFWQTGQSTGT